MACRFPFLSVPVDFRGDLCAIGLENFNGVVAFTKAEEADVRGER
jgi:hypothetical protein